MTRNASLIDHSLSGLEQLINDHGLPRFRAKQIAHWLYRRQVDSIEEMTNLPKNLRSTLAAEMRVGRSDPESVVVSTDGTKKYLFPAGVGRYVEAAYIPEADRATLCLSSQVGCRMGCRFCMTARQGFQGNLSAGEIVNQYLSLPERETVTNIVYMGMGEPLDNTDAVLRSLEIFTADWGVGLSQRRITLSTIGVLRELERFLAESSCHLAVSLHSPFDDERRKLMPAEDVNPIAEVVSTIRAAEMGRQRRVSFEYIVFKDVNHSVRHVKELARLLQGVRCRINLIRYHETPESPLRSADDGEMVAFQNALKARGLSTTIRTSRGQDVDAACGMLSTRRLDVQNGGDF